MLGEIPHFIEANKPIAILNGAIASLEMPMASIEAEPEEVDIHEAGHVIGARHNGTKTVKASNIPEGNSLGHTIFEKADIVGAMGPHSVGASGTGWDVMIANRMGNAFAAETAARSILNSHWDEVIAVARALRKKRVIGAHDIDKAINDLHSPKIEFGTLHIELPNGEKLKENVEIRDNVIMESGIWYQVAVKPSLK